HRPWRFFMMVETATDRLHHGFWADYDPHHPRHVTNSSFAHAIPEFYRFVDQQIASVLALLPDETTVMVISDHGAGPLKGVVAINEWLIAHGYLKLLAHPEAASPLTPEMVDWPQTVAWGEGGYYGRIFINVAGREPCGAVNPADYERVRDELAQRLRTMVDARRGHSLTNTPLKPRDLYETARNVPPDLMVYFDDLNYRSSGLVGGGEIFPASEGEGMDEANHKPNGIFITARLSDLRAGLRRGRRVGPLSCMDVVPTALQELGIRIPPDMRGRALALEPHARAAGARVPEASPPRAPVVESSTRGFSEEEEAIITQRLKDLGYM
ncbi:MAG: alkaline phosphatase family protein, partial [Desulfomonilaceae bacterium]